MKKRYKSKKAMQKRRAMIFGIVLAVVLVVLAVLSVVELVTGGNRSGYVVTEEGHIHTADGQHLGTVEELFGEGNVTVSEDGHIHTADGEHVGDLSDIVVTEEDHAHTEGESEQPAQTEAE